MKVVEDTELGMMELARNLPLLVLLSSCTMHTISKEKNVHERACYNEDPFEGDIKINSNFKGIEM